LALCAALPCHATIAVIDYTAIAKMVQQGMTQLQQLSNEVQTAQNTLNSYVLAAKQATGLADVARIYQQYQQTMGQLQGLYGQFANGGSLQNYLDQFQTVQYWAQVPPGAYAQTAQQSWTQNSLTEKQQNDAWAQNIAQHQQLLAQDAQKLQQAQGAAQGADAELAAIQANSQLLAAVGNQLLEIHALLVAEQQALQSRQASQANGDAIQQAATQKLMQWTFVPSSHIGW
jgi:P-type conjugative transfer protein TrbJ